jgi:hypothetical protein
MTSSCEDKISAEASDSREKWHMTGPRLQGAHSLEGNPEQISNVLIVIHILVEMYMQEFWVPSREVI